MEALTILSLSLAIFTFLSTEVRNVRSAFHRFSTYYDTLANIASKIEDCEHRLNTFQLTWGPENFPHRGGERITTGDLIWNEEKERVLNIEKRVVDEVKKLREAIEHDVGQTLEQFHLVCTSVNDLSWLPRSRLFRKLRGAFFKNNRYVEIITQITESVSGLESRATRAKKRILGVVQTEDVDDKAILHLLHHHDLSRSIFDWSRKFGNCKDWAIELQELGQEGDVSGWRDARNWEIRLRLSHKQHNHGAINTMRADLRLSSHDTSQQISEACFREFVAAGRCAAADRHGGGECLIVPIEQNYSVETTSLRRLFGDYGYFLCDAARHDWRRDRAHLILELVNWFALLWYSHWTSVLCCTGLKFAQDSMSSGRAISILGRSPSHMPGILPPDGQLSADVCGHNPVHFRYRNLGLTIAEIMCLKPMKMSTHRNDMYSIWERDSSGGGSWVEKPLGDVEQQLRNANIEYRIISVVKFCLGEHDSSDPASTPGYDGVGHLYTRYMEKVFSPVQKWHEVEMDVTGSPIKLKGKGTRTTWPQDATEAEQSQRLRSRQDERRAPRDLSSHFWWSGAFMLCLSVLLSIWWSTAHH